MITYVTGNVLDAMSDKQIFIPHICNNKGGWGAGFVLALSAKWRGPEDNYRALKQYNLGDIQAVKVEKNITVVNMIAQDGYGDTFKIPGDTPKIINLPPIRYTCLKKCMLKMAFMVKHFNGEIHAPKFGAGLAGGDWQIIENLIKECWCEYDIPVIVYNFEK